MRLFALAVAITTIVAGACARSSETAGPAPAPLVSAAGVAGSTDPLSGVAIAPEGPRDGYDPAAFGSWIDADHDGCDTRSEVLIRESAVPVTRSPGACEPSAGQWTSYLDGYSTTDPAELDIDHTVALAEAWDSGAREWSDDRRAAYANDLDLPAALHAVTASENARKGARDPADYQPARAEARCQFARDWISVKRKWHLSIDADEAAALRNVLAGC